MRISATSLWLPVLSGVLLALTLPYVGGWPLVWVALVPLFIFASNTALSRSRLAWGTILFGAIYAAMFAYPLSQINGWWWGGGSPGILGEVGRYALFVGAVGIFSFWGSLFFLPVTFLVRFMHEKPHGATVIALGWLCMELLRSFALFGYGWGAIGYTLIDTAYVKHIASFHFLPATGGVYLLSFLIVLGNLAFVDFYRLFSVRAGSFHERMQNTFRILLDEMKFYSGFWLFVGLFFFALLFGFIRVHVTDHRGATHRVAVIASQISTEESVGESAYRSYRAKLEKAFASGAELVVTPENVFPYFELNEQDGVLNKNSLVNFADRDALYEDFTTLLRLHPTTTVAVGLHTLNATQQRYNSVVYYQGGVPIAYYHKRKLVPFAEYIPAGFSFPLPVRFISGSREQYTTLLGVRISALLCSEIGDTTLPLDDLGLIISPSNDSVFSVFSVGVLHHQKARMRALEAGAFVLRASKGGVSSVIDQNGNVLTSGTDGVLVADIKIKK